MFAKKLELNPLRFDQDNSATWKHDSHVIICCTIAELFQANNLKMAVVTELDSFILKFRQLWKSGHDARLEVETKSGKACVALHLQLGDEPGPNHGHGQKSSFTRARHSPARERRRLRREETRHSNTLEVSGKTTEKVDNNKHVKYDDCDVVREELDECDVTMVIIINKKMKGKTLWI